MRHWFTDFGKLILIEREQGMDLDFSDDQEALRAALAEFFAKEAGPSVVRSAEPLGFDAKLWRRVVEMGLPTMAAPESLGGGGAGLLELAIAAEQVGRTLAPVPLVETAVATNLLNQLAAGTAEAGSSAGGVGGAAAVLGGGGEGVATLALRPVRGDVARLVPAGAVAEVVLALRGDQVVVVRPGEREVVATLGAMPVSDVPLDGCQVVASGADAVRAYEDAVSQWHALTAVALYGLGVRALELAIEYSRQRAAFGILIGSFQALQHTLADDVTDLEGARLLAYKAAWSHDARAGDRHEISRMASLFSSGTAFTTASDALHIHGGYGFTLEYDVQLYFRRAKAWSLIAGDRRHAYADLADRLYAEVR